MLKVNHSLNKYVVSEGKKQVPTIYSNTIKELYGTVDTEKVFYDILRDLLINELNLKTS